MIRTVGLTGGIATGKSAVSDMLREKGAPLLDADVLAREVVEPGQPALAEIARRFPGVVRPDGTLDRAALGARVFANPEERAALNAITHPRIQEAFARRTAELAARGEKLVIYSAALLVENRLHEWMDGVIVVTAPPEQQKRRLMERDRLTEAEAGARIASQLPTAEKAKHATWVIDNSGPLEATRAQVDRVWAELNATMLRAP